MVNTILGRKLGMTQVWGEDDTIIPVTVIQAGPCVISQVKTTDTDGYEAVQIGFGDIKEKKVNKPMQGHFAKAGVAPMRYLREVRVEDASEHAVGDTLTVEAFNDVDKVDVIGVSKGKGFAGVIKRYGFAGGPGGHGTTSTAPPVRWACALTPHAFSRVSVSPATWAATASRSATLSWCVLTRRTTSCWSRVPFLVARALSFRSVWLRGGQINGTNQDH